MKKRARPQKSSAGPQRRGAVPKAKVPIQAASTAPPSGSVRAGWVILVGWALSAWGLLSFEPYVSDLLVPTRLSAGPVAAPWIVLVGFALLTAGYLRAPGEKAEEDLSRSEARVFLALILGLAAALRFSSLGVDGHIWREVAESQALSRNAGELGDWYFLYPGVQSPIFHDWAALWFKWFPNAPALLMQRVPAAVFDLVTVWILYLLGREGANRRTGLFLALLGALSQPMVREVLRGLQVVTVFQGSALMLLTTLRFWNKGSLGRALLWAGALTYGLYAYSPCRPLLPAFLILGLGAWAFRGKSKLGWGLALSLTAFWTLLFLHFNRLFPFPWEMSFQQTAWLVPVILGALALVTAYQLWPPANAAQGSLFHGVLAVLVFLGLGLPLMTDPGFGQRVSGMSPLQAGLASSSAATMVGDAFRKCLSILFAARGDFSEPILGYFGGLLFLGGYSAGVARWVRRPAQRAFLLLLAVSALAGLSGYFLSDHAHDARLMGAVVPFLCLGALSLEDLWIALPIRKSPGTLAALGFVAVLSVWSAASTRDALFRQWAGVDTLESLVAKGIRSEPDASRVYAAPFPPSLTPISLDLLLGQTTAHLMGDFNMVWRPAGTPDPDLVVYVAAGDSTHVNRLKADYPDAAWTPIRQKEHSADSPPDLFRVLVPGPDLAGPNSQRLFHPSDIPFRSWHRTVRNGPFGLTRGLVQAEDYTMRLADRTPASEKGVQTCEGIFRAPQEGTYRFRTESNQSLRLVIDGKTVFELEPSGQDPEKAEGSLRLSAGDHQVQMTTYFKWGLYTGAVQVEGPGLALGATVGM